MEIKITLHEVPEKKEPIDKPVSFPLTASQKRDIKLLRDSKKIDVNKTVRDCVDQIINQSKEVLDQMKQKV